MIEFQHDHEHMAALLEIMVAANTATDAQAADAAFREVAALLDRLASRRIIHPNKAARKKSQLARHVAGLGAAKPVTIDDVAPVATSYPDFFQTLDALQ